MLVHSRLFLGQLRWSKLGLKSRPKLKPKPSNSQPKIQLAKYVAKVISVTFHEGFLFTHYHQWVYTSFNESKGSINAVLSTEVVL